MANNPHVATATSDAQLNQITTDLGASAILWILSGGQPANANTAVTAGNVTLASCVMASTNAFGTAAAGIMTANAIAAETNAVAGTAAWFTLVKSTGTRVMDGSVGTTGADLNLNTTTIATGAQVSITALTVAIS